MFEKRTDLALEVRELRGDDSGIAVFEETKSGIKVTTATVDSENGERLHGKPAGKYITVETGKIWQLCKEDYLNTVGVLSDELSLLIPEGKGCVLAVGLGNMEITPDSLGPRVVNRMLVTRHLEKIDKPLFENAGFQSLAAMSPGVLGKTGMESAETIKSVCNTVKPKCVIVIDALASRRLNRLATTVQLSNAGIVPGSGVSNKRCALNSELLGADVISVGVPMVVDAATLAYALLEEHSGREDEAFVRVIERVLAGNGRDTFVTPKENDIIVRETARLLATAINTAVHKMSVGEINDFLGTF